MSGEEKVLLTGYVSTDEVLDDNLPFFDNDILNEIKNGINLAGKIAEQINILNNNPVDYDIDIYDDLISYNNEKIRNSQTQSNMSKELQKQVKQNNKRLEEQKKSAQKQLSELKKQINAGNSRKSNLTKLNIENNKKFNFNNKNNNTEPLIKKKQKQIAEADRKNREISQRRAETLYSEENKNNSGTTFYLKAEKNNRTNLPDFQNENIKNINYLPDISNVEKTLFPNGTLADMPLMKEPLDDVKKDMEQQKENVIRDLKEKEIKIGGIGEIKLKELLPDIEKYIPPVRTKDEKRADIIYKDMPKSSNKFISDLRLFINVLKQVIRRFHKELYNIVKENYKKKYIEEDINKLIPKIILDIPKAINKAKNPNLFLQDEDIPLKVWEQILQDYINGSVLIEKIINDYTSMPDALGILKISGKTYIENSEFTKQSKIYNSSDELPDKYKNVIKDKLSSQHINTNSGGVYFYPHSGFAQRVAKSPILKEEIKTLLNLIPQFNDKDNIKNNSSSDSFAFTDGNLHYALDKVDVKNLMYTPDGDISGDIIDITDFNDKEVKKLLQAGRELQELGRIKPKFLIIHFVIPKEEIDRLKYDENI